MGSENRHEPEDWLAVKHNAFISGQFLWTGVDYLGECFGWPERVAQPGLLDLAGYEKPLFNLRKALWTDELTCKLVVGSLQEFWKASYVWDGEGGALTDVMVISNGDRATLWLNGQELATKIVDETCLVNFHVPYAPGELKVVCVRDGQTAQDTLVTPGKAKTLDVKVWPGDAQEVWQLEVSLLDGQGRLAATDDRALTVTADDDRAIMGIENGCATDLTSYASHTRPTWKGRAIVYVRKGAKNAQLSVPDLDPVVVPF